LRREHESRPALQQHLWHHCSRRKRLLRQLNLRDFILGVVQWGSLSIYAAAIPTEQPRRSCTSITRRDCETRMDAFMTPHQTLFTIRAPSPTLQPRQHRHCRLQLHTCETTRDHTLSTPVVMHPGRTRCGLSLAMAPDDKKAGTQQASRTACCADEPPRTSAMAAAARMNQSCNDLRSKCNSQFHTEGNQLDHSKETCRICGKKRSPVLMQGSVPKSSGEPSVVVISPASCLRLRTFKFGSSNSLPKLCSTSH
jgi:hypothetical protein